MYSRSIANILLGITLTAGAAGPAAAGDKVEVCHVEGNGSYHVVEVNENALDAHLNHGDHLPFEVYADADGDGFGDPDASSEECEVPEGYVVNGEDCDDGDAAVNPDATEILLDGIDQDCDGGDPFAIVDCAGEVAAASESPFAFDGTEGLCVAQLAGEAFFTVDGPAHVARAGDLYYLVPGHGTSFTYEHDPEGEPADETLVTLCDADCAAGVHIAPVGTILDGESIGMGEWDVEFTEGEFEVDGFTDGDPLGSGDAGATEPLGDKVAGESMSAAVAGDDPEVDWDGDGFFPPEDCDDTAEDAYPGAPEYIDGRDTNCDGVGDADVTPPEVHSVTVAPDPVTTGQTITITVDVTDDQEGVDSVAVWGSSPDGNGSFGANIWGVDDEGRWYGNVTIPETAGGGTWSVMVGVWDAVGNSAYHRGIATFEVQAVEVDSDPPVVGLVTADPAAVPAGASFVVTVEVSDEMSGISSLSVHGSSPSGASTFGANIWGVDDEGRWFGTIDLPEGVEAGEWTLDVYAYDGAGNSVHVTEAGFVEVVSPLYDDTPPEILDVGFDCRCMGTSMTVCVHTVDDHSDIDNVAVWGHSPTGIHSFGANIWGVDGDVWFGEITIPAGSEPGDWTIDVAVYDTAGNSAYEYDTMSLHVVEEGTDEDGDGVPVGCCFGAGEGGCGDLGGEGSPVGGGDLGDEGSLVDCDDDDPDTYPGAPEVIDGVDNNCDGQGDYGWRDIAAGDEFACGIIANGEIRCWGGDAEGQVSNAPSGTFTRIDAGYNFACAIDEARTVHCWGYDSDGQVSGAPAGSFEEITVGHKHACAYNVGGDFECWGQNLMNSVIFGAAPLDGSNILEMDAGLEITCWVTTAGDVGCHGVNAWGQRLNATPISDYWIAVDVAYSHQCAVSASGGAFCWGYSGDYLSPGNYEYPLPEGDYVDVAAGTNMSCVLDDNGDIGCWGSHNQYNQLDPPEWGRWDWVKIDSESRMACALDDVGYAYCWGNNDYQAAEVPQPE